MASAHPGFNNVAQSISQREGVDIGRARAMLAATTRRAGPKARKKNSHLNQVKGYKS